MKTYESIVKGQNIPEPGIPESFKVLIKELQSLGLDVKVLDKDEQEIDLKQNFDDDDDIGLNDGGTILEEDEVMTPWMATPWRTIRTITICLTIPAFLTKTETIFWILIPLQAIFVKNKEGR